MPSVQDQNPCPICGESRYSWGEVSAHSLSYKSDKASWLAKSFSLGYKLPTRHCENCGNVQIFSRRLDSQRANE